MGTHPRIFQPLPGLVLAIGIVVTALWCGWSKRGLRECGRRKQRRDGMPSMDWCNAKRIHWIL